MKKYLVILKKDKMSENIDNVGVFKARSEEDAKLKAATEWYISTYVNSFYIEEIDKIQDNYSFYKLM